MVSVAERHPRECDTYGKEKLKHLSHPACACLGFLAWSQVLVQRVCRQHARLPFHHCLKTHMCSAGGYFWYFSMHNCSLVPPPSSVSLWSCHFRVQPPVSAFRARFEKGCGAPDAQHVWSDDSDAVSLGRRTGRYASGEVPKPIWVWLRMFGIRCRFLLLNS